MNIAVYQDIIDQIDDPKIKDFTIKCLDKADPCLERIPASSSGKYHHRDSTGDGGLVQHVRRACYFAKVLMDAYQWQAEDIRGDIVISALLLHDIGKKEKYAHNTYDYVLHPQTACKMISEFKHLLPEKVFSVIHNCIFNHMGPWTFKSYKKPLEKYTYLELMTYQCDYMSSRKDMDIYEG